MDGKRFAPSRYKVEAEEVGLDEPPGDRAAGVQETREGARPMRAILDSGLLPTAAGQWQHYVNQNVLPGALHVLYTTWTLISYDFAAGPQGYIV